MPCECVKFIANYFVILRNLINDTKIDLTAATDCFDILCTCLRNETKCTGDLKNSVFCEKTRHSLMSPTHSPLSKPSKHANKLCFFSAAFDKKIIISCKPNNSVLVKMDEILLRASLDVG